MSTIRRIKKELDNFDLLTDKQGMEMGIVDESNCFEWYALIPGPVDSPYEGGLFCLHIELPKQYPFRAPKIKFQTKIYHPVFHTEERWIHICELRDAWEPTFTIYKLLLIIREIMVVPDIPAHCGCGSLEISNVFMNDPAKFQVNARVTTKKYAM